MINKLTALEQGNPLNSRGSDVVTAVNSLIDSHVGYKGTINSGDINDIVESGYYIVTWTNVSNNPFTGNYLLEVRATNGQWVQQIATGLLDPDLRYIRTIRPANSYPEWQLVNKSKLHGKRVLFLGDSILESYNVPNYLGLNTGAEILNGAFGGSRLGRHTSNGYKQLSGWQVAEAISTGDWSQVKAGAETTRDTNADDNTPQATMLENLDFNTVDYLVVGYGTNDFSGGWMLVGDPTDTDVSQPEDVSTTWCAHLNNFLTKVITKYPHLKIVMLSPLWRFNTPSHISGVVGGSDEGTDSRGQKLIEFVDAEKLVCERYKVICEDMYRTSGIGELTKDHWLVDGLHPTQDGARMLAGKIQGILESKF